MSENKSTGAPIAFEGVVLIVLGCIAIANIGLGGNWFGFSNLVGLVLIAGGLMQFIVSFCAYKGVGMSMSVLNSLTLIVFGVLAVFMEIGPEGWSVLFVIYFLLRGIFELIMAGLYRENCSWAWLFFSCIFSFFFALLMFLNWSVGAPLLMMYIGFNLLFTGITRLGWGVSSCCCPAMEQKKE